MRHGQTVTLLQVWELGCESGGLAPAEPGPASEGPRLHDPGAGEQRQQTLKGIYHGREPSQVPSRII